MITDEMVKEAAGIIQDLDAAEASYEEMARTALQAALSVRGEVKPVAWVQPEDLEHLSAVGHGRVFLTATRHSSEVPIYTTPPAQAVAVKGLEWRSIINRGPAVRHVAGSPVGRYEINKHGEVCLWSLGPETWELSQRTVIHTDPDGDEVVLKVAAQADYEQRIRSALVSTPPDLEPDNG